MILTGYTKEKDFAIANGICMALGEKFQIQVQPDSHEDLSTFLYIDTKKH